MILDVIMVTESEATEMATVFKREKDRKKKGARWIISWFDAEIDKWRHTTGYTDKELSLDKGRRLESESACRKEGRSDPVEEHRLRPIREHLAEFITKIRARNRDECYLSQVENRITRIIEGVGAKKLADLDPIQVDRFLMALRIKGRPLSGVTRNEYIGSLKAFTKWAVEARRLDLDPLASLKRTERRAIRFSHPRRALSVQEVARLLNATERRPLLEFQTIRTGKKKGQASAKVHPRVEAKAHRLGRTRRLAYLIAVWAGLRRSEIKALQWGDIDLNGIVARMNLRPETTKSKRADSLVIHPELAAALRASQPENARPTDRVVRTVPGMKTLRADLKLAGIDLGSRSTGFVDFHALRKTLSTVMAAGGMSQRARQAHMRHTDPRLTENTYMDERLLPIATELMQLPPFSTACKRLPSVEFDASSNGCSSQNLSQNAHKTGGSHRQNGADRGTSGHTEDEPKWSKSDELAASQVEDLAGVGTNRQGPALVDAEPFEKRVMGLEPTTFTLAT